MRADRGVCETFAVPREAVSLALAASIYPPAVAAVIALGRGADVRLRVMLLVSAALLTAYITGLLILVLFADLGATSHQQHTVSAGLYIAVGLSLIAFALHLRRARPAGRHDPEKAGGSSKIEHYLQSRRLVLLLGFVLYVFPSPIYIGVVKAIADAKAGVADELIYLAATVAIMLWMIEVPTLVLLAFPRRGSGALELVNDWFARHGRVLAIVVAAGAAVYLLGVGLLDLAAS